jgi:deoxyribodipyrimidine photolyase-related protein
MPVRHLLLVLGDQLDPASTLWADVSPAEDLVWMAEVPHESTKVWSHKVRIVLFLSAMRHFADRLRSLGWRVDYQALDRHDHADLAGALRAAIVTHRPAGVRLVAAGEHGVAQAIETTCAELGMPLEVLEDNHFLTSADDFDGWRSRRRQWVMEHFYRSVRRRTGYLMDGTRPVGGQWNLDKANRRAFPKQGPGAIPLPFGAVPDGTTREVIRLVESRFADHPGSLSQFDWPVTQAAARDALADFIENRLAAFGPFQDAMWPNRPWLYHSRLSAALNLKLLSPREVLDAVIGAYDAGGIPLSSAEGFVRQVLGWREYVRHVYWATMPELLSQNALDAQEPLPAFYWTGETEMACLHDTLQQTLRLGYAHHIQRLMVTGLFALLLGVVPRQVHEWYLAVYVDAVEWVEAPNTLGMSQYADGGRLASKPYVASGRYLARMSSYCSGCRYAPSTYEGDEACPFTILYWDFLLRHESRFAQHPRTALQWRNLARLDGRTRNGIRARAASIRATLAERRPIA